MNIHKQVHLPVSILLIIAAAFFAASESKIFADVANQENCESRNNPLVNGTSQVATVYSGISIGQIEDCSK